MSFTTQDIPGLMDLPDSLLAAGQVAAGWALAKVLSNAKFGAVATEVFYGEYRDGDEVPLPVSTVDGYQYAASEILFGWALRYTANPDSGSNSGRGELLFQSAAVDSATRKVSITVAYYQQGGAETDTNDGLLGVWTFGIRGKGDLAFASAPGFFDLADTAFNLDAALTQTNIQQLNKNAKLSAVRSQIFYSGAYSNGQTVPVPTSPVDGYVYSRAELVYIAFWIHTVDPTTHITSGPGRVRTKDFGINVSTGVISTEVSYWDGHHETFTTDGLLGVIVFAQRTIAIMAAQAASFVDINDPLFFNGVVLGDTNIKNLNKDAKFSILRPEFFRANYSHGQTIPLPTSPIDGYVYTRSELTYIFSNANTATPGGAQGGIALENFKVDPATGVVTSEVHYNKDGGGRVVTNNGSIWVLTIARRSHVTIDTAISPPVSGIGTPEDDRGNLIDNGTFERWSRTVIDVADAWEIGTLTGNASAARQAGIFGNFAQGLVVSTAGTGNAISVRSQIAPIFIGDLMFLRVLQRASVTMLAGYYVRLHFLDSSLASDVYVDLVSNGGLSTTASMTAVRFGVPKNGDTQLSTTLGLLTIQGTLNFAPAYARLELMNSAPNVAATISVDAVWLGNNNELGAAQGGNFNFLIPSAVAGFTRTARPDGIEVNWTGGAEGNLAFYNIYRSSTVFSSDADYTDAKIVMQILHAGNGQPHRAFYPVSATAGAFAYGIRAVNDLGQKSAGVANNTLTYSLDPEGGTNIGVPGGDGQSQSWSAPGDGTIQVFRSWAPIFNTVVNLDNAVVEFDITYTGGDGASPKKVVLSVRGTGALLWHAIARIEIPNATITNITTTPRNIFGTGTVLNSGTISVATGSKAQDTAETTYDPTNRLVAFNRVRGQASNNLQLDTITAGFTVDVLKKLNATAEVQTSAVRAASGDLTLDAGSGGQIAHGKIADFSVNSHKIKEYAQLTRPTLASKELVYWGNAQAAWHIGLLYLEGSGNYVWFRRTDTDPVVNAIVNPADGNA